MGDTQITSVVDPKKCRRVAFGDFAFAAWCKARDKLEEKGKKKERLDLAVFQRTKDFPGSPSDILHWKDGWADVAGEARRDWVATYVSRHICASTIENVWVNEKGVEQTNTQRHQIAILSSLPEEAKKIMPTSRR